MGWWVAVCEAGVFILPSEALAHSVGRANFGNQGFFVECLGCEIMHTFQMNAMGLKPMLKTSKLLTQLRKNESFVENDQCFVKAKFSCDGTKFSDVPFQLNTGAQLCAISEQIVLLHPEIFDGYTSVQDKLHNFQDDPILCEVYHSCFIQLANLTTKVQKVARLPSEDACSLLGFDVVSRYVTAIDVDATPPLRFVPRSSQLK